MRAEKKRMRVALVVPNFDWCEGEAHTHWDFIPYNLCILAATIKDVADVQIIDANHDALSGESFADEIRRINPDVVGLTALMDQYGGAAHYAAMFVKSVDPLIRIVMGGVYATMNPEKVLQDENVDYVIVGEGERVLRDLLKSIELNESAEFPGLAYRIGDGGGGGVINNGHSVRINDLDALPLPEYGLINFLSYVDSFPKRKSVDNPRLVPYARILTSRGCPYSCCFCQVEHISGKKFRSRSADGVLGEIEWLKKEYGIKSLIFDDDNLFISRTRALAIFDGMVDRGLAMPWVSIATPAFKLDEELLDSMVRSGCEYIDLAIESGSPRVLKEIIGKPLDLDYAHQVVAWARMRGIYVAVNFVIGFPGETWAEIRQSIRCAESIGADYVKIFAAMPLPKTRLWEMCEKADVFKVDGISGNVKWNAGQIETAEFTARDLTILRAYEWDRINFNSLEKEERTAKRMGVSVRELRVIRKKTLCAASRCDE